MEYRKHGQTVTLTVTLTANHIDSHSDKQRQTFSQSVSQSVSQSLRQTDRQTDRQYLLEQLRSAQQWQPVPFLMEGLPRPKEKTFQIVSTLEFTQNKL